MNDVSRERSKSSRENKSRGAGAKGFVFVLHLEALKKKAVCHE